MNLITTNTDREAEVQSPFLPGTQIQFAWDSTSLGYLKTCPRLYQYIMIDGWGQADESIHLRFGIEYHQALQEYDIDRRVFDHDVCVRRVLMDLLIRTKDFAPDETTKAGKYKNRRSLVRTVLWYLDQFADDPAETFILQDGRPAVELSFRFELDWGPQAAYEHKLVGKEVWDSGTQELVMEPTEVVTKKPSQPYLLSGHLDRVVEFGGSLFVMDHKTTTTTPSPYYFNQFEPNNQMTLYTLASKVVMNSPIKGVIISAAQLLVDASRFVRGFTYRTPDQLEEWTVDLRYWLTMAESYATMGYWPMNDTACGNYGGCRFREICSKSPQVREKFLNADFVKLPPEQRWNPLKPR